MERIYFDNSATTKPLPEAVAAMTRALCETWANPSSVHGAGIEARALVEESRRCAARALGVRRDTEGRVIFTSSGTEADNLAILGTVYAKRRPERQGSRGSILSTDSEHPAVEEALCRLEADGFTVYRTPTRGGALDLEFVRAHAAGVILATMMLVNNESGALYDVKRAFSLIRAVSPEAVTHTDAVQAFGKVRFTPQSLGADAVTVSGHKIGGPKGIGALYVSAELLRAKKLIPMLPGGGQEAGMRSGTENVPGIAGFGAAARLAAERFDENAAAAAAVRAELLARLAALAPEIELNEPAAGIPHIVSLRVSGVRSEIMLNHLSSRGICVSAGSACSAHARHVSRAMLAFGLTETEADETIRVSISPANTPAEAASLAEALAEGARRIRKR